MVIERKWRIVAVALAVAGGIPAAHAAEAAYPNRPLRLIVPYPPGGSTDPTARAYGSWLADKFGVSIVIDNRPGAGATIGHALGAKATPDGYTLLLGTSAGLVVSPAFGTKLAYDPIKDLAPVRLGVYVPFLLVVHPSVAAKNTRNSSSSRKRSPARSTSAHPGRARRTTWAWSF